jgi:hypothetical protein
MAWLHTHQRKGWEVAFNRLLEDLLDERGLEAIGNLDEKTFVGIQINLTEWLLAEGSIWVKGGMRRVADYLIGPHGPALTSGQRNWIQQLSQRPLRLYNVTDVQPGESMTLCDALEVEAKPMVVFERSGSQSIHPGNLMGARIMRVDDHFELSGAAYPFSMMAGNTAASRLLDSAHELEHLCGLAQAQSLVLMSSWLDQYLLPMSMPSMVDVYSGEPIVSITDHYRVLDWQILARRLQNCADIEGDLANGWARIMECEDGQRRPSLSINLGKKPNQIEVFYITQSYADQGRGWLESLAGDALVMITRKVSDPANWARRRKKSGTSVSRPPSVPDLDPQDLTEVIAGVIHRTYANWCDEPIPALGNKTPRQAIQSAAGMERVKGLLRSYEFSEKEQARQQGRAEVSYDFLWAAIGLKR